MRKKKFEKSWGESGEGGGKTLGSAARRQTRYLTCLEIGEEKKSYKDWGEEGNPKRG